MNYAEINSAILEGRDVGSSIVKNETFYKYLFNNKVAYYYASQLSANKNEQEEAIIKRGWEFDRLYIQSLKALDRICRREGIPYLLFKTHKYIPEVIDGDIDLLVKPGDFQRFLEVFAKEGFETEEDEPGKGKCEKEGYCLIEPHINISWRKNIFLEGELAWQNTRTMTYQGVDVPCASPEIELLAAAGELYFSPEYIDLFRLTTMKALISLPDFTRDIADPAAQGFVDKYIDIAQKVDPEQKLPYFLPAKSLLEQIKECVPKDQLIEIGFKNWYWRVRYQLIDKLPFTHEW